MQKKITPIVSNSKDKVFSYKHKFPIQLNKYDLNVSKERNRNKKNVCQYVEITLKVNFKEITSIFKDITPACFKSHKHRDIVELNIIYFVNWSMNDKLTKNHPDTMRFF